MFFGCDISKMAEKENEIPLSIKGQFTFIEKF